MADIDSLIHLWQDTLLYQRYLLEPSITYLIEQTIKQLEELKSIKATKP